MSSKLLIAALGRLYCFLASGGKDCNCQGHCNCSNLLSCFCYPVFTRVWLGLFLLSGLFYRNCRISVSSVWTCFCRCSIRTSLYRWAEYCV